MKITSLKKIDGLILFLFVFVLAIFSWQPISILNPQKAEATTISFTTSGSWVAPTGVTSVLVEAWGGGGAGGGRPNGGQAGGGGGGAFASATISVTPGLTYNYTVGAAVAGGNGNGTNGNLSQWETGGNIRAAGGSGGLSTTTGGLGGAVANSVGTLIFKGGDGGSSDGTASGGGGGGAGTTGAGGNANVSTAGSGTTLGGGTGGTGILSGNSNGNPGSSAGGGGSGARRNGGSGTGGDGAAGQIRITYNTAPVFTVNTTETPDPVNYGSNVTFSATATDNEHSWKLVVCKTNSVTPGVNPTCASGQTVCVSSTSVASGVSNNCVWASDQTTNLTWFSFACDDTATMPTCTTANTTNSPLTVNVVISVAITTDGTISYGTLNSGQSRSTLDLGDTQTAQNDTNVAEDFNIKTNSPAGWTLGATPATDVFVHEFSTDGGGVWTKFITNDSYQTLATNVLPTTTQNFDLRFTSPNPSTSSAQKSIDITIQAVQN